MTLNRRELLLATAALAACTPARARKADVLAAGQPAAILLLALAPDRLIGWPRRPSSRALAMLPNADLPETGALTGGGAPAGLEAVAALGPTMVIDYGDLDPRYRLIAERVERRLAAPYHLLDGALGSVPAALSRAGMLLSRAARARLLADRADAVLSNWRRAGRAGPSFYYARGEDGLETGFAGSLATEVLEGAGWTNLATGGIDVGRVSRERIAAWDPEVLVTLDEPFARRALVDPVWSQRRGGGTRRILLIPDLPFGWFDRPPSINRLLGCAWLAGGDRGDAEASELATLLWEVPRDRLAGLAPRWLR